MRLPILYPMRFTSLGFFTLLILFTFSSPSCTTDVEEEKVEEVVEVETAMEAITTTAQEEERDESIKAEMNQLDEESAAEFEKEVEKVQKEKEQMVATSPILKYAENRPGLIKHLREKVEEARPNCEVDELFGYLQSLSDDPIFKAVKNDPTHGPELKKVYGEARKLKGNCKGR